MLTKASSGLKKDRERGSQNSRRLLKLLALQVTNSGMHSRSIFNQRLQSYCQLSTETVHQKNRKPCLAYSLPLTFPSLELPLASAASSGSPRRWFGFSAGVGVVCSAGRQLVLPAGGRQSLARWPSIGRLCTPSLDSSHRFFSLPSCDYSSSLEAAKLVSPLCASTCSRRSCFGFGFLAWWLFATMIAFFPSISLSLSRSAAV